MRKSEKMERMEKKWRRRRRGNTLYYRQIDCRCRTDPLRRNAVR